MRVLVVHDESLSGKAITQRLTSKGAVVDQTDHCEEAVDLARRYDYDIILARLSLPGVDGYTLIRRLRAAGIENPVILEIEQTQPKTSVNAFTIGADDVVTIPCDHAELFIRMQAIVRRNKRYSQPSLCYGPVQLNLDSRDVLVSGEPVHLTGKEFAVLELLILRKGMVLTKEMFLNHLYRGINGPEAKIIDVFICKLRRKLADAGAPNVIGTIWGRGYMVHDFGSYPMLTTTPKPKIANLVPVLSV